ncbi:MAG: hypothetical protein Q9167_001301 [Letrouitia subvulpina]
MELLNKSNCPGIIKIRAYRRYKKYKKHRIYMEYARHGDLENLRQRYLALKYVVPNIASIILITNRSCSQSLPEKFLWDLFYYLASACMVMSTPSRQTRSTANVVVHRDIKPPNRPSGFNFYPTPKLGDFGIAELISRNDFRNPAAYHGPGTNGWKAPEQYPKTLRHEDSETKLLSWTNVWAVGAVMYELVLLPDPLLGSRYRWPYDEDGSSIPPITSTTYSQALRNLVRDCLHPTARSRPTPAEILDEVGSARNKFLRDLKRRRKNGDEVPNPQEELSYHNLKPDRPQGQRQSLSSTLTDLAQFNSQGERLDAPSSPPPGPLRLASGAER